MEMNEDSEEVLFGASARARDQGATFSSNFGAEQPIVFGGGSSAIAPVFRHEGGGRAPDSSPIMFSSNFGAAKPVGFGVGSSANSSVSRYEGGGRAPDSSPIMFSSNFGAAKPVVFGGGASANASVSRNESGGSASDNSPMFSSNFGAEKPVVFGGGSAANAFVSGNEGGRAPGSSPTMFSSNFGSEKPVVFGGGSVANASVSRNEGEGRSPDSSPIMFSSNFGAEKPVVFGGGSAANASVSRNEGGGRAPDNSPIFSSNFGAGPPVGFGGGFSANPAVARNAGGVRAPDNSSIFSSNFGAGPPVVFGGHSSANAAVARNEGGGRSPDNSPIFSSNIGAEKPVVFGDGSGGISSVFSNKGGGKGQDHSSMFSSNFPAEQRAVFGGGSSGNASVFSNQGGGRTPLPSPMFASSIPAEQAVVFGGGLAGNTSVVSNKGVGKAPDHSPMFSSNSNAEKAVVFRGGSAGNASMFSNQGGVRTTYHSPMFSANASAEQTSIFGGRSAGNTSVFSNGKGGISPDNSPMFSPNATAEQTAPVGGRSAGNTSVASNEKVVRAPDNSPMFSTNAPAEQTVVFGGASAGNTSVATFGAKGRERSRSPSSSFRPVAANLSGGQQDAGKFVTKSPDQQSEEEAAKARRLVRFGSEFGTRPDGPRLAGMADDEGLTSNLPSAGPCTAPEAGSRGLLVGHGKWRENSPVGRNETTAEQSMDMEAPDHSNPDPILGICPDMCPEIERRERERKGDLDRFERLGGNRSQTSRDLAVKKYTRTAEKDPVLIRPLPVLENTMSHLLSLLERDHDDDLLALHSFLWDRMRAVRMDLRMQHIFTEVAITMHEQMIRFHILAMHELCEFSQGEGISEVFNAHLNIEQMNKASVDLFEMYEDHSKRGTPVISEAEFRGYYALLKLDKHPGYRVEPAELSLDLAKMTPEIRNSEQVLFARNVARACRASNYVTFFRLAREATYLQACLMHAHFSKLRTQALAALHSGLQKNQGLPLSTAIIWLGMEGEDTEALVKYHGFSIKDYEEPYVVKEGPFLNKNQDFPTCRAQLVEAKRSLNVVLDVQPKRQLNMLTKSLSPVKRIGAMSNMETVRAHGVPNLVDTPVLAFPGTDLRTKDGEVPDYTEEQVLRESEGNGLVIDASFVEIVKDFGEEGKTGKKRRMEERQLEAEEHERRRLRHETDAAARRAASQAAAVEMKRQEEQLRRAEHTAEAISGKQGLWLRKWRRRAASKALERHRKLQQREAALDTLSLGYPLGTMQVSGEPLTLALRKINLEALLEEQGLVRQQMWEPMNVPKLVGPILQALNPDASFLYWKVLLSTPSCLVGNWVQTKVGSRRKLLVGHNSLHETMSGITLAEEKVPLSANQQWGMVDLWYYAKEMGSAGFNLLSNAALHGAGGLLFVINGNEPVGVEQARLHSFVEALPEGASIPLLLLSAKWNSDQGSDVLLPIEEENVEHLLKLRELSSSKVSRYEIISIVERSGSNPVKKGCFSEEALREGLIWLARHCPLQPFLRSVHVADLVREHVDSCLKLLQKMPVPKVGPDLCISLFNNGLQNAAKEIGGTAGGFSANWSSCSRVKLEDEGQELILSRLLGNSKEAMENILANIKSCMLPLFPALTPASSSGGGIKLQKRKLEEILLQFCTSIEGNRFGELAMKWEVSRLIQRGCTVEWSESGRKLVTNWAQIFKAIFSYRLLVLNWKPPHLVYLAGRVGKESDLELYGSVTDQILTGPDCSDDGQLLLDEVISEDYETEILTHMDVLSSEKIEAPFSQLESPTVIPIDRTWVRENGLHEWKSRPDWAAMPPTDGRLLHSSDCVPSYGAADVGCRFPQGRSLTHFDSRDDESRWERRQLAPTESERLLEKMVADFKQSRTYSELEPRHREELSQEVLRLPSSEQVTISIEEAKQSSGQESLLVSSPFEVILNKMVTEFSRREYKASEERMCDISPASGGFGSGIEEYRTQFQGLQS